MSYPPQPGQDPNNPYAQPQPGQQPGYGYPQQPGQQAGYGYPQQSGLPAYGGYPEQGYPMAAGYGGGPMTMPGTVKSVRILLFVLGGFAFIGAIAVFIMGLMIEDVANDSAVTADADAAAMADLGQGLLIGLAVIILINGVVAILLGTKVSSGGNGWRIGTIVFGALTVLGGLFNLPSGILSLVIGVLIIVFMAKSDGKAWYNRPRY